MKNAERKQVIVTMYCVEDLKKDDDVKEIPVRLTRLEKDKCGIEGVWYIEKSKVDQLFKDYNMFGFQKLDDDKFTRLPDYIQRVIVLDKNGTYYSNLYTAPEIREEMRINKMKNAKRKRVMVPMYGSDGQEIWVRLTRLEGLMPLEGDVWYITERRIDELLREYGTLTFKRPDAYIVTPLPDYIQRVVIQLRDGTYYEIYRNLI